MFSNCFSAVRKGCRGRRSLVVVLAIPLLILGVILVQRSFYRSNPEKDRLPTAAVADNSLGNPAPPPFPYQELTIPFLRNRDFKSSLGALEIQAENSSYTAYLTSYDSDGLRVSGLLTIPRGEEPEDGWPAVVFVHGYIPPSDYQTTQNYIAYVDYLARSGLVVFKIDLRGHGESEGEPGGGYYSSDYIIDTLNAYRALQSADFVNPERVGLWGHSMAGNVVFRSLVVEEDIPAVVIWAGAVYTYRDFSEYRISDDSYRQPAGDSERRRYRESLMETYGEFDPESDFWRQVAPTNYLDGVTSAIQLNHAVDDPVVAIGYSRNLVGILEDTKIIHELNEYPSGGHNISGPTFSLAIQATAEFYREHLR